MPGKKSSKKGGRFKGAKRAQERRGREEQKGTSRDPMEYELVEGLYGGLEIKKRQIDADMRKKEKEEVRRELEARKKRKEQNMELAREAAASRVSYVRKPMARRSWFSIGMLAAALLFGGGGIYWAVATNGQAPLTSAAMVLCSLILGFMSFWYGLISFLEEGRNYVLARICIGISSVLILGWAVTIFIGMRG